MKLWLSILMASALGANAATYFTNFLATENPISQGGNWINGKTTGLLWSNVATSGGKAIAQQNNGGGPNFNDATAVLTGTWGSNQTVVGVLSLNGVDVNQFPEIELRTRTTITANSITGYEHLWSLMGAASPGPPYNSPVRWNGAYGSFTDIGSPPTSANYVLTNGALVMARAIGNHIYLYTAGVLITNVTDSTYVTGSPGMGFDHNGSSTHDAEYGWTFFSASDTGLIYFVTTNGNDSHLGLADTNTYAWRTIAHADSVMTNGDTLIVGPGVIKNWYIDNTLTNSANDGTSWGSAWTNFSIAWGSINAGDTIYISGGPAGGTNTYYGQLSDQAGSPNDATFQHPITIKQGIDAGHNGDVSIIGGIFLGRNYWQIDGSKGGAIPSTAFDTRTMIPYNCGIHVFQTNGTYAVQLFGTGAHIQWVEIQQSNGSDNGGILWGTSPTRPAGVGSGVDYNWIHNINGFGIRAELSDFAADTFSQFEMHHNLIQWVADNFMQVSRCVDFYDNMGEWTKYPSQGHPDMVQEIDRFSRIWGNVFHDNEGSAFYVEANSSLTHDVYIYNNLTYSTTNVSFEVGSDITGHDGDAVGNPTGYPTNWAQMTLSNIWIFNNTAYAAGKDANHIPKAFAWNGGLRTNTAIFKMGFLNNAAIQVAPWDGNAPYQFSTNHDYFNGANGMSYSEGEVAVNYNNISGGSGNGKGIYFGNKGHGWLQSQFYGYTNFAQMALDYPQYSSNNNTTAKYASLAQYDFRPQVGDTALVKMGTNLTSFLSSVAPYSTNDILGNPRGASWAIGAFEPPPGFYVAITGNDTNIGTWAAPWRTVQHGANIATNGQTVYVTPGAYEEDVTTVGPGVTFRGYPENDPAQPALVNTFSLRHTNTTIAGLTFHKWINNNSAIYVYPPSGGNNGSGATISNNTLRDGVGIISSNASFFASSTPGSNYIYCAQFIEGGDFNNAGFKSGMGVYLGSYSLRAYANCGAQAADNSFWRVDHVSADGHYLYVTNLFQSDSGTNYFAWIVGGNNGPKAQLTLEVPIGSSIAASNITFVNNIVSNTWGCQLDFGPSQGTNEVSGNLFTRFHGQYLANPNASNFHFARNAVIHNKNMFFWGDGELSNTNLHPSGGKYYDNQCSLIIAAQNGQTNNCWENNLFWDVDNEFLETDWNATGGAFLFRGNIFYDIPMQGSLNMSGTQMRSNTMVRVGFDERVSGITGMGNTTSNPQIGADWIGNVALNCSGHFNPSQEAPFGLLTNTYAAFSASNNVSLTSETMGWGKTAGDNVFTNAAGTITTGMLTNNGDPILVNIYNPVDPNWVFTPGQDPRLAMIGFVPLPNSYIAQKGIGALAARLASAGTIAHYTIRLASPGWKDLTLTNYDLAWAAMPAYQRPDVIRPVSIPEAVGYATNSTVTWDASGSLDDSGTSYGGITNWHWACSDGFTLDTNNPVMVHALTTVGTNTMTLTTTTSNAVSSVYAAAFRVLGPANDPAISVNPQNQTVCVGQNATFTVTASGGTTLHYQWRYNGVNVGTDSSSYTRTSVVIGDNGGIIDVVVNDFAGNVTSSAATLTVNPDPVINTQPQNQTVSVGQSATVTVSATSCAGTTLHFAWTFNGVSVGTDSSSYTRPNCQLADNGGILRVTVSDTAGSLLSSTATLTVNAPLTQTAPGTSAAKRGSLNFGGKRRGN